MRVEAYLAQVKVTSQTDLKSLKERTEMATRSLGIKLAQQCFDKPIDQQAPCLAQNPEGLVLDDANTQSLVSQLTGGDTAALMNAISSSNMAGAGAYSPTSAPSSIPSGSSLPCIRAFSIYSGAGFANADTLNLAAQRAALVSQPQVCGGRRPASLGPAKPEPLHPVASADSFCAQKPGLVLPAEGAPMVFASDWLTTSPCTSSFRPVHPRGPSTCL